MHAVLADTLRPACMDEASCAQASHQQCFDALGADLQRCCQALQRCLQLAAVPPRPRECELRNPPL